MIEDDADLRVLLGRALERAEHEAVLVSTGRAALDRELRSSGGRVVGGAGDGATRIENRIGEPAANPYLYMAAQIHAGLDGLARGLTPPRATESPYASDAEMIPTNLPDALTALQADSALVGGFGADFVRYYSRVKQSEAQRHAMAEDTTDFERREYFSRF